MEEVKEYKMAKLKKQPKTDNTKEKKLLMKAKENTTVVSKVSGEETVLKEGTPLDHHPKQMTNKVVGVNIGITKNMGDYESLRVDVWLTDEVQEKETVEKAYARIVRTVDTVLQNTVQSYL